MKMHKVEGLNSDVSWGDACNPEDWRDMDEPEGIDQDDDQDEKIPEDVKAVVGFDPDEEGW